MYTLHQIFLALKIKDVEIGGACSIHGRDEKCIQNFNLSTLEDRYFFIYFYFMFYLTTLSVAQII
jgi:hypothetical protein